MAEKLLDKSYTGVQSDLKPDEPVKPQDDTAHDIAKRIFKKFDDFRRNRDTAFAYFRERSLVDYLNDCNQRFNNYRIKPDWKEPWQANISDVTTHSKLMAIVAQVLVNKPSIKFYPRMSRDIYSEIYANLLQNIYFYTETEERNGDIDELFTLLKAAREGTVIAFEGYKKTHLYEGIDFQFVPLNDFYPGNVKKFDINEQVESIWRSVIDWNYFVDTFVKSGKWVDAGLVKCAGDIQKVTNPYFDVSRGLGNNDVEILRYFNALEDEFHLVANGVLITPKDSKLSERRKSKKLGFTKTVYEPYDDNFFYGRSIVDVLKDTQDAVDFLFNAMFDKEMLSVMRPILVGGVNDLNEDFWYPGASKNVADVTQVKELGFEGPDMNSFRILQELERRQTFASIDPTGQGMAIGRRTATEVERAQESAKRIYALFNLLVNDFRLQKAKLRTETIQQFYITNKRFEPFIIDNTRLLDKSIGTQVIRFKNQPAPSDMFGVSPQLKVENAMINKNSEIIEINAKMLKDLSVNIKITSDEAEVTGALKRGFDREFATVALARPDLYDQKLVAKNFAKAMYQDPEVVNSEEQLNPLEEMEKQMGGGELANEAVPTSQHAMPSLKSLITNPITAK